MGEGRGEKNTLELTEAVGVFLKQMDHRQGVLQQGCVTRRLTRVFGVTLQWASNYNIGPGGDSGENISLRPRVRGWVLFHRWRKHAGGSI